MTSVDEPAGTEPCPCHSGRAFDDCCGPILRGSSAPTAEALMRSRFTAFALRDATHLLRTWHPSTRPAGLELDDTEWIRLQIVDTVAGGVEEATGIVEFRAIFRDERGRGVLHERSRFERNDGGWCYVDGDLLD